jgi:hypothetical protein
VLSDTETWSQFPDLNDAVWKWADDGRSPKHTITFVKGGTVRWNKGKKGGYWKLTNDSRDLETRFLGNVHKLRYIKEERRAVVIDSDETESSKAMWGKLTVSLTNEIISLLRVSVKCSRDCSILPAI